jgi:FkbM family methyltransferase
MSTATPGIDGLLGPDWRQQAERRRAAIESRLDGRRDVVLFGSGYLGRQIARDLGGLPYTALAFVDNNPATWGSTVSGLEVLSPTVAAARFGRSVLWLITVYTNSSVITQLEALKVPWMTCAELSWLLPEPHPQGFEFGTPESLARWDAQVADAARVWADEASAREYADQVHWRFLLDYEGLANPHPMAELYFPEDLVVPLARETFVDCGAFTGDTVDAFLARRSGAFEGIIAIEPDPVNCAALRERISDWARSGGGTIRVEVAAVGAERGQLQFSATGTAGSKVGIGASVVDVAPLDELLSGDRPTYMKFDVEGAEHDALMGGARVISEAMPVMAICLYHRPEDIWDLPLLVRSIAPDYRLFMRRYSDERWETVLYAVPPDRLLA